MFFVDKYRALTLTRSWIFSVAAWIVAIGIYMLIRWYGTKDTMDWITGHTLVLVWLGAGFLFGSIDLLSDFICDSTGLRKKSYGFLIFFRVLCLILGALILLLITRLIALSLGQIGQSEFVSSFTARLTHKATLAFFLYLGIVDALFSFIRQMVVKVGGRVMLNLILGKYRNPKTEDRIFMFLDLKSSTSHAERLGHARYSRLIQDCFYDLTDSAIKHKVEIYQYVGDEAILTWKIKDGISSANCINVYFEFDNTLKRRSEYYQDKYGFVPEFKAGVNTGSVTVAEVGIIKRDIAYHSDVLNTAARIQGKCNEFGKMILISTFVKEILPSKLPLKYEPIGSVLLRGKMDTVDIYSVEKG